MTGKLKESPSQTAGPYVHIGCVPAFAGLKSVYEHEVGASLVNDETGGERITIKGRVFDGAGEPLKDAMVEIWQADAAGFYNSPFEKRGKANANFTGFGRAASDGETGEFRFKTIKPGAVPFDAGRMQAPHITFWIVARGINIGLHTRMYFGDEKMANSADPTLNRPDIAARTNTLIAERDGDTYTFDIHLQGDNETVFFDS